MNKYKEINHCVCCEGTALFKVLDLGPQPLVNSYHKGEVALDRFPLAINVCLDCFHTQLTIAVDPDEMFKKYFWVSGTTQTMREYFDWFALYINVKYGQGRQGLKVLDIACNDGSQLSSLKKFGFELYGVDPAENLASLSRSKGINLTVGYWNEKASSQLPIMDIIIAQNVLAHNSDPFDFMKNCLKIMTDDSVVIVQTSQADMFINNEFDTIQHEHISFFSAKSMQTLAERSGLIIIDVFKPSIHGTSYVFVMRKTTSQNKLHCEKLSHLISSEEQEGRYDPASYWQYNKNVGAVVSNFKKCVEDLKREGKKVVGYGAAGKAITFLNYANLKLDYIVDDNEMKQGYLTPGMDIPIKSPSVLKDEAGEIYIVPLAWNFFDEIVSRVMLIRNNPNDKFIKYFPSLKII